MFYRIMYPLRINHKNLVSTLLHVSYGLYYRGLDNISVPKRYGLQLTRLLSVWFRFMPVFVKFYGSLMAHGYGSEKSRVVTARFNRGYVPRF